LRLKGSLELLLPDLKTFRPKTSARANSPHTRRLRLLRELSIRLSLERENPFRETETWVPGLCEHESIRILPKYDLQTALWQHLQRLSASWLAKRRSLLGSLALAF